MPATHSPTPARSWIIRLARVCWERKKLSAIVVVASVSTILLAALTPLLTRQAVNDALAGKLRPAGKILPACRGWPAGCY
jgi:ATP-binding cassette subfamily B salmochelin/enterobactin exporter